jgi:X-X-X-Leu-X-X-Gly heptad repeat protein
MLGASGAKSLAAGAKELRAGANAWRVAASRNGTRGPAPQKAKT